MIYRFWKRAQCLAVAMATVSLVGAARGDSLEPPATLDGWFEVRSPNLRLISDLEARPAHELLASLEALRSSVTRELLGRPTERQLPATVVAFAEEHSYAPFRVADREGQFYSTPFESLIVLNGGAEGRPLGMAAAHEYTHALLAELEVRLPLWLHEGLAEYYSTFLLSDGRVAVGRSVPGHRTRLRNRAFDSFEELAGVDGRSSGYHGLDGARFYAQSWLSVHYLLSEAGAGLDLAELVQAVRAAERAGGGPSALLGLSGAEFDRELRRYLNRSSVPVMLYPAAGAEQLPMETRQLSSGETAYQLGVVALEQARWDPQRLAFAQDLLEAAVALDPTRGDAQAGLGSVAALSGQPEVAVERFERAVFLDALEGRTYAYYARHLIETAPGAVSARGRTVRRAREMLARALELEPGHRRLALRLEQLASSTGTPPGPVVAQPPTAPM